MRLLALSLFSLILTATAAIAQVSNGTVPVPATLAGQNVGAVNGRSNGFGTAGISAPQSTSASPGTEPTGDGTARSVVPPPPSGVPPSGSGAAPPASP
jgi:hypothetical protein